MMEGILVIGGIKSEPSNIELGPPNNGASIEITFSDIESGEDEPMMLQPELLPEHLEFSENEANEDPETTKKTQDVFKYVGYDSAKSIEAAGECIFNFTRNEDLCVGPKDTKQVLAESKKANSKIDLNAAIFIENRAPILAAYLKRADLRTTSSAITETQSIDNQPINCKTTKAKIDLNSALYSEDLSWKEYKENYGTYRCLHCGYRDPEVSNIKTHIIDNHKKTELKQCPYCDVKTRVIKYHLRTVNHETTIPPVVQKAPILAAYLEKRADLRTTSSATTQTQPIRNKSIIRKAKKAPIDLNSALYSEDLSWKEYKEKRGTYRCLHCGYRDRPVSKVKTHIIDNHKKTELKQCPYCDVKTRVIKYHLRTVNHETLNPPVVQKCKDCDYETANNLKFNRHIKERHEIDADAIVECNTCQKAFVSRRLLLEHIRNCHSNRIWTCKFCSYTAKGRRILNIHMDKHKDPDELKTYKCDKCNFKTKYKVKFYMHKAHSHKLFICDQCGTKLSSKPSLKLHLLLHKDKLEDEDLKFRCVKCDYKTNRHYNLVIHNLKHKKPSEKQFFYCYHCDFKANRKDNLKTHIFKHFQKEEVTFQCFICDFTATKKHVLIRHIDKHAGTK